MCHDLLTYTDTYQDGDTVAAGGLTFQVLSTPGHTPGSVCLLCENVLFSGDTLFAGSYGRTDFLGGSSRDMAASLKRLSMLPPETRVLPGHGPSSTIEEELRTNPYLRGMGSNEAVSENHTERYPVEQLQLQLFAQEPSEFCTEPFAGDGTVSSLSRGKRYLTATAKVTYQGKTGFAVNRVLLDRADVRATRRILQRSYYLAALQVLPAAPPWGALSGVRPTKLSTKCLMAGGSEKDAEKLLREVYFVSPERARLCVDASRHTVEAAKLLDADDLSVYIGIPFCPTRCAYCSFVSQSIERFGEFLPAYLDALLREIAHTGALLKIRASTSARSTWAAARRRRFRAHRWRGCWTRSTGILICPAAWNLPSRAEGRTHWIPKSSASSRTAARRAFPSTRRPCPIRFWRPWAAGTRRGRPSRRMSRRCRPGLTISTWI